MKNRRPDIRPTALIEEAHVHILCCRFMHLTEWNCDNASVPYWRLYWNKTNGASIILKGRRIPLHPSQMYLVTPNAVTSNRLKHPVDHFFIHFAAEPPYDMVTEQIIQFPVTFELAESFQHLRGFSEAEAHRKQILSTRALFLCYYALSRIDPESLMISYRDRRIMTAINCMDGNMSHPASNETLARSVGMHPTAFIRLFKQCTGYAPQAYFQVKRIEQACRLLHFSDDSIDEIASVLGFYDRYHFSRMFKKIRGISPAKFRRLV